MGSIVHRSVPTNLKWLPNCSHAHALFQDRFKDVQVGSRWFSTLYILSPNFHNRGKLQSLRKVPRTCAKIDALLARITFWKKKLVVFHARASCDVQDRTQLPLTHT